MTTKKDRKKNWTPYQLFLIIVLLSLILFFLLLNGTYKNDQKTTISLASETISFLEDACQRYENSALDTAAESMQDVLSDTVTLRNHMNTETLEDQTFLSQYASEQRLTGILILDKALNQDAGITLSGTDGYSLWKKKIHNYDQNAFTDYPNKTFTDRITLHGTAYDVAVVSRKDKEGLILCYKDTEKETTDTYALSFETMLKNNTFHKNPRIIITDNKKVLTTNIPGLQSLTTVNDSPLTDSKNSQEWTADDLIRIHFNRKSWYGLRKVYGQYYIYVFYSANEIFSNMIPITAVAVAFYAIACIVMLLIRQHYQLESNLKQQKQIRTIKAIASLYSSTALIDLKSKTTEPIHLSPQLSHILKGNRDTKRMLHVIHEQVIAPEYRAQFAAFADLDTLAGRLKNKTYLSCIYQDTAGTWYTTYLIPERLDDDGNVTVALVASRNINDYKSKEEEYKEVLRKTARDADLANAAKTTFLRRMSHDVRTPINGIRGMAAIARRRIRNPEDVEECLDKILSSSDYLLDLVNDVLRMSKLESGKVLLEEKSFNLKEIITETVSFIEVQAAEKNIHFINESLDLTHPDLIGSPLHIRQIIQNIMTNAIKYTPSGGEIRISCRELPSPSAPEQAVFEFTCADTGIGMSEEFQEHAFEPFVQEHDNARTTYAGTGLGLSIVKDLVDRMGGTIELNSKKDVGTTFIITLTLKIDSSVLPETTGTDSSPLSIDGTRILLVEDNELNIEIARSLLEDEGAVVTTAVNGLEAVDTFRDSSAGEYQLILMDVMMPVMDGLEAARQIRLLDHPDAVSIPIFAMTANSFVEDIQKSKEAGMNEHFTKPLNIEALVKAICQYCK